MSASAGVVLMENGTGNGADVVWAGGHTALIAEATFGGGNVALHMKLPQGGGYAAVTNMSLTAAGMVAGFLPPGTYRAVVTTATAVYARLARIPA